MGTRIYINGIQFFYTNEYPKATIEFLEKEGLTTTDEGFFENHEVQDVKKFLVAIRKDVTEKIAKEQAKGACHELFLPTDDASSILSKFEESELCKIAMEPLIIEALALSNNQLIVDRY
ncbi:MAG: hypothetical protein ACRCZB_05500 [Bacteroidales bacterium]